MKRSLVLPALALAVIAALLASAGATAAPAGKFRATKSRITETSRYDAAKSVSGRAAQTDKRLLRATSSKLISVMVKLDYDAVASYAGSIKGLPATSPAVTGKSLDRNASAVAMYKSYVRNLEAQAVRGITARVPSARVLYRYQLAYGGLAVALPANQVKNLLGVPGVAALQRDKLLQPDVVEEPYQFIGAESVWTELDGPVETGEGIVVANLDTGIWPEHPMFADLGLDAPPAPPTGTRACEFGLSGDPNDPAFACQDKLIGAQAFTDTYTTFQGALAGEYCDATGPGSGVNCSARDADGHGTHTLTTAAGNFVASAPMWGIDRGPTSGMAPGAHVIGYRVCLNAGCFTSDSAAAVDEAINDGADVINFSISGGNNAYSDAVELAFLDFYASGGLASASAGNAGPGPATANHAGPWTNTVGASYPSRIYQADLHLESGADTLDVTGVTITPGIGTLTDVIRPSAAPGYTGTATCNVPLPNNSAAGKIVLCERGNPAGRAASGFNVLQGDAVGMILTNVAHQDLFTDLHWLPTIMINDGTWQGVDQKGNEVRAFVDAHPGTTQATFTTGTRTAQTPDIMTSFSSRGPLGDWIKPDVTAPGIEILAGRSPQPHPGAIASGPPGDLYMAIAGTSMSSPHAAGVSALVMAAHPTWTPGQVKSALMTSSVQTVLKPDGVTPADPFNTGAGSIRANLAIDPTVTLDETAATYIALGSAPTDRIDANLPSINATTMPGIEHTTRTLKNVSGLRQRFAVTTTAPAGGSITVQPSSFALGPNQTIELDITIEGQSLAPATQYFGGIDIDVARATATDIYMPVAFFTQQGIVSLTHTCTPTTIPKGTDSDCSVVAQNNSANDAVTEVRTRSLRPWKVDIQDEVATLEDATGTLTVLANGFEWNGTLDGAVAPTVDSITPGGSPAGGYLPLSGFGIPVIGGMGDETIANFNTPAFKWGEEIYTRVGVTSNGYAVIGGGTTADVEFEPQTMPDPARPNNVIAPWWTDLDLSAGGGCTGPSCGARIATLTDGGSCASAAHCWIVIEWENVPTFGSCTPGPCDRHDFQIWLGVNSDGSPVEDVTMAHGDLGTGVPGFTNAGAENRDGTSGKNISPLPTDNSDWTINTSGPQPGGKVTVDYDAFGAHKGTARLVAHMESDQTPGTTSRMVDIVVTGGTPPPSD